MYRLAAIEFQTTSVTHAFLRQAFFERYIWIVERGLQKDEEESQASILRYIDELHERVLASLFSRGIHVP